MKKITLNRSDLQTDKYTYTHGKRDTGDGKNRDNRDRNKVNKNEDYEVFSFIENLLNDNSLEKKDIKKLEDILQSKELSNVVDRDKLIIAVMKKFKPIQKSNLKSFKELRKEM